MTKEYIATQIAQKELLNIYQKIALAFAHIIKVLLHLRQLSGVNFLIFS